MAKSTRNDLINTLDIEEDFSDSEHKSYKLYNFRRPDKFSKDNLRALRDIHREFSKAISLVLSGYLRMRVEIEIVFCYKVLTIPVVYNTTSIIICSRLSIYFRIILVCN